MIFVKCQTQSSFSIYVYSQAFLSSTSYNTLHYTVRQGRDFTWSIFESSATCAEPGLQQLLNKFCTHERMGHNFLSPSTSIDPGLFLKFLHYKCHYNDYICSYFRLFLLDLSLFPGPGSSDSQVVNFPKLIVSL